MTPGAINSIAILGAGKLGMVVAQLALRAGIDVFIAGSASPDRIRLSVDIIAPGATACTANDAIARSDVVLLALPLGKFRSVSAESLSGKVVIDAMNYWWEVDGTAGDIAEPSTSELVQRHFQSSRVVKALSHMGYHDLHDGPRTAGDMNRKAIAVAGDEPTDVALVAGFIDDIGFDPLLLPSLAYGRLLEPGNPAFGANVNYKTLQTYLLPNRATTVPASSE